MNFNEILKELKQRDIEITFSEGHLKYSGPEKNITQDFIEELRKNKEKLIRYFWPESLKNVMPLNVNGSKVPLFIVHGDNANYIIRDYLGPDQPVYGFFHPSSNGGIIPYKGIKQMAKAYLEKVRIIKPAGPYYLMGFSLGGVLAYEMAIQLKRMGQKVPFLVLIDSNSPLARERLNWNGNLFKRAKENIISRPKRRLEKSIKLWIYESYRLFNKPIPIDKRKTYLYYKYLKLGRKYSPDKFDGDVLLFRATGNKSSYKYLGWDSLVNNIRLVELEGKHLEIFIGKERTDVLKTEIEKYLAYVNGLI